MDSVCLTKFGELKPGSHVWDREKMSFKDPDTEDQTLISKSFLEEHNKCYSCALKRHEEYNANCVKAETEVTIFGRNYHRFDFVYVTGRRQERDILKVAQIVDLLFSDDTDNLKVKFFCRYEDDTWAKVDKVNERVNFIPNPYVRLNSQRLFRELSKRRIMWPASVQRGLMAIVMLSLKLTLTIYAHGLAETITFIFVKTEIPMKDFNPVLCATLQKGSMAK